MMCFLNGFTITTLFVLLISMPSCRNSQLDDVKSMKKIDVHMHIFSDEPSFRALLDEYNFKVNNLVTDADVLEPLTYNDQREIALATCIEKPRLYSWVTTFGVEKRNEPDWAENVIKQLKEDFDNGALGIKVWKQIGMKIKHPDGRYIQIDDPIFAPILEFIEKEGKTFIPHIGEPVQAWMLQRETDYWGKHPEWLMWDQPEKPSFNDCIAALDHVIRRYPDLRIVGAHLASLEFDVNEISKRLDIYPNFAVEIGGRVRQLMWQPSGKVRHFMMTYQDRIMYGTDMFSPLVDKPGGTPSAEEIEKRTAKFIKRTNIFLRYLATDDEFPWSDQIYDDEPAGEPTYVVSGLNLPKEVLYKIFYENPKKWFPGIEKDY